MFDSLTRRKEVTLIHGKVKGMVGCRDSISTNGTEGMGLVGDGFHT